MSKVRGFEVVKDEKLKSYSKVEDVKMPERGSKTSAGYDFFTPCEIEILPGEYFFFWSDIKAYMLEDEVLNLYPRSSTGIKKFCRLKNTIGIIDSDYYSNVKNDGNIGICLHNFGDKNIFFKKGEAVCQGIFSKFLESDNCNTKIKREGGIGSTNK